MKIFIQFSKKQNQKFDNFNVGLHIYAQQQSCKTYSYSKTGLMVFYFSLYSHHKRI
jgi:hypothetical protein